MKKSFLKNMSLSQRREMKGLLFVAPFILGMLLFLIVPMIKSFIYSFGEISMSVEKNGLVYEFIGLENYRRSLLDDFDFLTQLTDALKSTIHIPFCIIVSFLIAVLLKDSFKGRTVYRIIFFLPVIISSGILPVIDNTDIMQGLVGSSTIVTSTTQNDPSNLINVQFLSEILSSLDIGSSLVNYVMSAVKNIIMIINSSGIQILIFLAALQTVSPSIYEAARVEGATGWEIFWKITLPMISPQVLVVAIYTIIETFVNVNNNMMRFLFDLSFKQSKFGYSAASSWIYLLVVIIIVSVFYFLISRFVFYNDKER